MVDIAFQLVKPHSQKTAGQYCIYPPPIGHSNTTEILVNYFVGIIY